MTTGVLLQLATAGAVLLTVIGCSNFSGAKLGDDAGNRVIGVPYTLVRPEYTLTRTPPPEGQKKASYILGVAYEPDPNQRYTLRINPGLFADPTFLMKLGTGGVLQGTSASVTEQLTPTITAIGSFGANLIGALATGVFDKDSVRRVIVAAFAGQAACSVKPPDVDMPDTGDTQPDSVGAAMAARMNSYKDDAEFAELFHYATDKELQCLKGAKDAINSLMTTKHDTVLANWKKELAAYKQKFPEDTLFIGRLTDAVATDDTKQLDALADELKVDKASGDAVKVKTASDRGHIYSFAKAAALAAMHTEAQEKLAFFMDMEMDAPTWRARHLLYLEREIDRAVLVALRRPSLDQAKVKTFVDRMRVQRAVTIGARELFYRALELERFLEKVPNKSVDRGGTAPAAAEYATIRAELDAVVTQIDSRRTRVIADAKPAPPPPITPLKVANLSVVKEKDIEASKTPDWIKGRGAKAPNYVMVLTGVE